MDDSAKPYSEKMLRQIDGKRLKKGEYPCKALAFRRYLRSTRLSRSIQDRAEAAYVQACGHDGRGVKMPTFQQNRKRPFNRSRGRGRGRGSYRNNGNRTRNDRARDGPSSKRRKGNEYDKNGQVMTISVKQMQELAADHIKLKKMRAAHKARKAKKEPKVEESKKDETESDF